MDRKRILKRLRTIRIVFLVLAAVARGILGGELMYIILDGHFTSMCWFHADMEACTLASIASTLLLIVSGSFLLLDVLGGLDVVVRGFVAKVALFVDGLLIGQLVFIFLGAFLYTLVQWIRTVVDWPYITLDDDKHVCPESDDCSIPVHVHYCAMILLVIFITNLCLLTLQFFTIKKALACIEIANDAG
ncbi:uncharacterized protein LOC134195162 [Corticium candelabrum]|uniref:uncharacterized protein LOC134195162 n=1 Tax=Corticium candelabrum TaxID=121492 RepID=UPI002E267254|nr:uncharacterized protein LOC134195162 [Corticium candelabrum]